MTAQGYEMWSWIWVGVALAGKWDGRASDVVATREIAAAPEAVFPIVQDLAALRDVYPESCVDEWVLGAKTAGVDARATIRYDFSAVRRRLPAVVRKADSPRVVDIEHEGKRGFTTRFELTPSASGGTTVEMTSFLSPPPKPFQGKYFKLVQPAWIACQVQVLDGLAAKVGAP